MSGIDKDIEALLKPQSAWLDGGRPVAAGATAAGPWHSSNATRTESSSKLAASRFDTSIGGRNWREDEREPVQRRDVRWADGGEVAGVGVRQYAEPQNPAWTDVTSRSRGRGSEVNSWKPREREGGEWRNSNDGGSLGTGGGSWRAERWAGGGGGSGNAPGVPRGDSWRGGGVSVLGPARFGLAEPSMDGSRALGMGRGRGRGGGGGGSGGGGGLIGGIGAAAAGRGSSSFFRAFGGGGGVGGKMRWGTSKAGRRYNTDQLAWLYKQLLYSGRLKLPPAVEHDDPLLFLADGEFVDVVEQLMGMEPGVAAQAFADHYSMVRSSHRSLGSGGEEGGSQHQHSALLTDGETAASQQQHQQHEAVAAPADEWMYKDPQGVVQGPFARQDIIDWYEAGYFPLELKVRAAGEAGDAPFKPLAALLKAWNKAVGPPGFSLAAAAAEEPAPSAAPKPEPEPEPVSQFAPAAAPLELPDAEDVLSASLHHMALVPAATMPALAPARAPTPNPHPAAVNPQPADPIIDPVLIMRSASAHLLQQQQLAGDQQMLPLAQLQAMGCDTLQQKQQQAQGQHPEFLVGRFPSRHAHPPAGLLQQQDPFLGQQHAMPTQYLPPAPMPHHLQQHQQPLAPLGAVHQQQQQPAELPAWLTEPPHPPAPVRQHAAAPKQEPVALVFAPAQPAGPPRTSLLDIQHEQELQEQRRRRQELLEAPQRAAAAEEEERRRQHRAALLFQQPTPLEEDEEEKEEEAMLPPHATLQQPQAPRPETKVAPWAGAAPKKKTAKALLEIQQEEAERAAHLAAQESAAAASLLGAAPIGSWAKAARGNTSGGSMMSLRDIQEQQQQQRAAAETVEIAASTESLTGSPMASSADANFAATAAQAGTAAWSSGGAKPAAAAAAQEEDGGLFWDYGVQASTPAPAAKPSAPSQRKPAAPAAKPAGWASAVVATMAAPFQAPPPAPPPRAASTSAARPSPALPPRAVAAPATAAASESKAVAAIRDALNEGNSALGGAFRAWCQDRMCELTGSPDVTLCEFLLTVESNSELAEYCTLYLGNAPAVARFATEFMKRKLAEAATTTKTGKSRKNKAKAAAASAPAAAASRAPAAGPPGYAAPTSNAFPALGASAAAAQPSKKDAEWEKVPKTVGKKKKGKKLEPSLLGFASGTNYELLEKPQ